MKKLELKYLAPYLPYGITFKINMYDFYTKELAGYKLRTLRMYNISQCLDDGIIVLRPLSDLTKEIRIDDRVTLMFMKDYFVISQYDEDVFFLNGTIPDYWKSMLNMLNSGDYKHLDYWILDKLFEWHFDVFGLIEKGLAVNYNEVHK